MSEMKNGELAGMFVVCNFVRLYNQMQKKKPYENNKERKSTSWHYLESVSTQRIYMKRSAASDVFIPILLLLVNEKQAAK